MSLSNTDSVTGTQYAVSDTPNFSLKQLRVQQRINMLTQQSIERTSNRIIQKERTRILSGSARAGSTNRGVGGISLLLKRLGSIETLARKSIPAEGTASAQEAATSLCLLSCLLLISSGLVPVWSTGRS